jgi:hypothetical protein
MFIQDRSAKNGKLQTPSSKLQRNFKHQAPKKLLKVTRIAQINTGLAKIREIGVSV